MRKNFKLSVFGFFLIVISCTDEANASDPSAPVTLAERPTEATTTSGHLRKKWISRIFLEAEEFFDMAENVSPACKNDYELYKLHLSNQSVWAVRMLESSQWPSTGIFAGMTHSLGNWDECLRASAYGVNGQYCLAQATYNFTNTENQIDPKTFEWTGYPKEEYSAWSVLQMYEQDVTRVNRQTISWALCIPSSCGLQDLRKSLNRTLYPVFSKYDFNVSVDVNPCQVQKEIPFSAGFYLTCLLFLTFGVIAIAATIYDNREEGPPLKESLCEKILGFFSIGRNYELLSNFSPESSYPVVHLLKITAGIFVLIGHRIMTFYFLPTFNTEQHEMYTKNINTELLQTNVVDVFFTVSGYLMVHYCYQHVKKVGLLYLVLYYVFRWLRMIFLPSMIILFIINIVPYLCSGPFCDYYLSKEIQFCEDNWWATLLAVNNIVHPDQQCIPQTWYISVDMQLTILAGILLYIITKHKKIGISLTVLTMITSFVVTYVVTCEEGFDGLPKLTISNLKNFHNLKQYAFYTTTYARIGSYFTGFLAAIVTKSLKEKKYTFSPRFRNIILISSTIFGLAFNAYGFLFYKAGRPYNPVENGIYAAFARTLFVLPCACLLCIHFTSGLGSLNKVFDKKIYTPVGRLVYGVYLIGPLIQIYLMVTLRTFVPIMGKILVYWIVSADIVWSYALAFVLYIFIEMPFNNFLKLLQRTFSR